MKSNELSCKDLMVGDWVIPHFFDSELEPSKIIGISYNSYRGKDYVDWVDCEVWDELSINDIEPIPLTPEILEKNGFERAPQVSDVEPFDTDEDGNKHYSYNKTFWGWFQPNNTFCIPANGLGWLNIKYVHQLQHALRLCGIEKEIKLEE